MSFSQPACGAQAKDVNSCPRPLRPSGPLDGHVGSMRLETRLLVSSATSAAGFDGYIDVNAAAAGRGGGSSVARVLRSAQRGCGGFRRSIRRGTVLNLAGPDIGEPYCLEPFSAALAREQLAAPRRTRQEPRRAASGQVTAAVHRWATDAILSPGREGRIVAVRSRNSKRRSLNA